MSTLKNSKIGVYGPKDRLLQRTISFERIGLTWKVCNFYKYLGSRTNATPDISDISDPIFLEVADRAYDQTPVTINCWYDALPESQMDLTKFGIISPLPGTQTFKFHIDSFTEEGLGRYPVNGDIFEVPFLEQNGKKTFFEITDVDKKSEFEKFYIVVTTVPIKYSQETIEIPDKDSYNSDIKDILQSDITDEQENEFVDSGLDQENLIDVQQKERTDYRPTNDLQDDFLDNPNKKVF